jgi:hypothetical protein
MRKNENGTHHIHQTFGEMGKKTVFKVSERENVG